MRPIVLKMSAFGPYAELTMVDFAKLDNKNIFLITGPTGAGKTTLFDAISYALYGDASGESRGTDSLRSDFASEEVLTFVELEFELRNQRFKITRYPQQNWKKSRGEGYVQKNTQAELLLPDGGIITKVNNVDEKINELLGINKQQFRQIVMLAQGEFRKLIEADSVTRESIFRKIFGTQAFEVIQKKLSDRRNEVSKNIYQKKTERDAYVRQIDCGESEQLRKLISADEINIIEIVDNTKKLVSMDEKDAASAERETNKLKEQLASLQRKIAEGVEINKKLEEEQELTVKLASESEKKTEYEKYEDIIFKARKALQVRPVEENFKERQLVLLKKEKELIDAENGVKAAEKLLGEADISLIEEENKEDKRSKLSDNIATLKSLEQKVSNYEDKVKNIINLRNELDKISMNKGNLKAQIKAEKDKLEKVNKELDEIKILETKKVETEANISAYEVISVETEDFLKDYSNYEFQRKLHFEKEKLFYDFEKKYNNEKLKYENMEDDFRKGQAGILASKLIEGNPCPVCGSVHHPMLAQVPKAIPTEEEIKLQKKLYDRYAEERSSFLNELSAIKAAKDEIGKVLARKADKLKEKLGEQLVSLKGYELLEFVKRKNKETDSELRKAKELLQELLKKLSTRAFKEKAIVDISKGIQLLEKQLEEHETLHLQYFGKVRSEEEVISSVEKDIPEAIRTKESLMERVTELSKELDFMNRTYKQVLENKKNCEIALAACKKDLELRNKNIKEARDDLNNIETLLKEKLSEFGFESYEQYYSMLMTEDQIQNLNKKITSYNEEIKSLKDRMEKAKKDVEGLNQINLEELSNMTSEINEKCNELDKRNKELFSRIKNNRNKLLEIQRISSSMKNDEQKYDIVSELSRIANGDNSERISFERYVLAAYFDEIITAANLRLSQMTSGRFVLNRIQEKGKGRRQEGLELEVFDNYTGKSRHVKTLSGGESFKASMSMALGLADVVQAYAGGISLDTIFIDEGFGTLDPESLDNAIQCLYDLQKGGRMVGIISHVPDLKDRIEARFEVTPAKEGSKIRIVI